MSKLNLKMDGSRRDRRRIMDALNSAAAEFGYVADCDVTYDTKYKITFTDVSPRGREKVEFNRTWFEDARNEAYEWLLGLVADKDHAEVLQELPKVKPRGTVEETADGIKMSL